MSLWIGSFPGCNSQWEMLRSACETHPQRPSTESLVGFTLELSVPMVSYGEELEWESYSILSTSFFVCSFWKSSWICVPGECGSDRAIVSGNLGSVPRPIESIRLSIRHFTLSPLPSPGFQFFIDTTVCVVAYLGLFMLCVSYQVDERTCVQFSMKVLYFLLSALGLTVCMLAVAFAAHHYSLLEQFTCETSLDACLCKLPSSEPLSRTFVYRDVADCTSVTDTFKLFLIVQMVLNPVCGLVCLLACFVMWKHRYQVFYVGVGLRSLMASDAQQQKA
ncbi:sarcospan-like protein [Cricetulus griseus]|nr:sarcospan-like protein [Cricetulus griseus]